MINLPSVRHLRHQTALHDVVISALAAQPLAAQFELVINLSTAKALGRAAMPLARAGVTE